MYGLIHETTPLAYPVASNSLPVPVCLLWLFGLSLTKLLSLVLSPISFARKNKNEPYSRCVGLVGDIHLLSS
jgi:hypothetical protein